MQLKICLNFMKNDFFFARNWNSSSTTTGSILSSSLDNSECLDTSLEHCYSLYTWFWFFKREEESFVNVIKDGSTYFSYLAWVFFLRMPLWWYYAFLLLLLLLKQLWLSFSGDNSLLQLLLLLLKSSFLSKILFGFGCTW